MTFASLLSVLMLLPCLAVENVSTFSIVAYDPVNRDWGVAVASRYFSVGSVVPWAEANIGAIATQANVNVGYGPRGLELLKQGLSAKEVLDKLLAEDQLEGKEARQVAIVDAKGNVAAFTGIGAPSWAGDRQGKNWSAQGNILVGPQVLEAMGKAFDRRQDELAERLYAALQAGDAAGGDSRGRQSASMLVVRKAGGRNTNNDRYLFINVDDNPQPFPELRRLLDVALGTGYLDRTFKLVTAGKPKEAREAVAKAIKYMPSRPGGHVTLGLLNYVAGDKAAAVAELRKARELDPGVRKQVEAIARFGEMFRPVLDDKEFMEQLFGNH